MDYSKLSDFEINNRVAKALGAKQVDFYENGDRCAIYYELGDEALTVRKGQALVNEQFNPCNNPEDAWPVIVGNAIGVMPFKKGEAEAWSLSSGLLSNTTVKDKNPLRAAMIVYLMMQEGE